MSFVLIAIDQRHTILEPVRTLLSIPIYPIQILVATPIDVGKTTMESIATYRQVVNQNRQLQHEQLILKSRLFRFDALEKENIRLRALLGTSFKLGEQVMVAELQSVNLDPYQHIVLINKGRRFGVYKGQPVVDAFGIAGQVVRVNPLNAEIILITDPNHAIPVEANRTGLRTIAVGSGQINKLILPYLPNNADMKTGDLLVTSGLGGTFPQGYPVARVTEVYPQPGQSFSQIHAQPMAHLNRSRELLLVWTSSKIIPLFKPADDILKDSKNHVVQ